MIRLRVPEVDEADVHVVLLVLEVEHCEVRLAQSVRIERLLAEMRHVIPDAIDEYIRCLLHKVLLHLANSWNDARLEKSLLVVHDAILRIPLRIEKRIDNLDIDGEVRCYRYHIIILSARDIFNSERLTDQIHAMATIDLVVKRGTFLKVQLAFLALQIHVDWRALVAFEHFLLYIGRVREHLGAVCR